MDVPYRSVGFSIAKKGSTDFFIHFQKMYVLGGWGRVLGGVFDFFFVCTGKANRKGHVPQ